MKITIPSTPPSINTYMHKHWKVKDNIKQEWVKDIFYQLKQTGHLKNCRHVHVSAVITFKDNRIRDASNYASTLHKFLDDALVTAGMIPDDTAQYISHDEPVLRVGDKACTVIEIKEEN